MTTIRGQRPAVNLQPNSAKKGLAGRSNIFHVSTMGGQIITTTANPAAARSRKKSRNQDRKRGGNRMEFVIHDIAHAAPNMQLVILVDQHPRLARVAW